MRRSPAPTCSFQRSGSCVVSRSSPKWCCVLYCPALLWVSAFLCEFFCVSFFLYLKLLSNSIAVSAPADVWATSVPPSRLIKPSRPRSAWGTSKLSDGESAIETALDNNNRLRHTHESSEKMVGVEDLKDAAFSPDESYVALVLKDLDAGFRDPLQYERTGLLN